MDPKLKAILTAIGWSAFVGVLQALETILDPPYKGIVTILITLLAGVAKYAPQSAVVMGTPTTRLDDRRVMDVPKIEAKAQKLVDVGEIPPIVPKPL